MTISETIRKAVRSSGKTMYAIAQETGIPSPVLSRFMADGEGHRDIRLERTADRLAAYLGLELMASKPSKPEAKPRKK